MKLSEKYLVIAHYHKTGLIRDDLVNLIKNFKNSFDKILFISTKLKISERKEGSLRLKRPRSEMQRGSPLFLVRAEDRSTLEEVLAEAEAWVEAWEEQGGFLQMGSIES